MNIFSCNYQILRTLLLAVLLLAGGGPGAAAWAQKQENRQPWESDCFVHYFGKVDSHDTMIYGIFREADRERLDALLKSEVQSLVDLPESDEELMKLAQQMAMQKQSANSGKQKRQTTDFSASAQQKKRAEIEAQRKKALKQLDALPESADKQKMVKEINAAFDKLLAELPDAYSEGQKTAEAQSKTPEASGQPSPSLTADQKYAIKKKAAALAVGGRLWREARDFRWGRAAVATLVNGEERWGFIDESGRQAVPCKYWKVYDFKNRNYRTDGMFDPQGDQDTQMWTTVVEPESYKMGMIDSDGREVIPCRFVTHTSGYDKIVFHITPWGEYAPVQEQEGGKYGIIDRNGNYTLPLTYDRIIRYDYDRECFSSFDSEKTEHIYFDHRGNRLSKQ